MVMAMLIVFIVVMVSGLYTHVQTHQIIYIKYVQILVINYISKGVKIFLGVLKEFKYWLICYKEA